MVAGKPVPKTEEEIIWFVEHMRESLLAVKSMGKLAELWNFNAVSVKALPERERGIVVELKNACKERLKQA